MGRPWATDASLMGHPWVIHGFPLDIEPKSNPRNPMEIHG